MAKSRRAPSKSTKKAPAKASTKKHRGSKKTKVGTFARISEGVRNLATPRVVGGALLALGLFFTAAFVSGSGAWLGDMGMKAATRLLGVTGYALAPLAALAGLLLLIERFPLVRVAGVALILIGWATTLAAMLPEGRLFDVSEYIGAGGIVGSAVYGGVYQVAGVVGAVVLLAVLYAAGLSLVTGISFAAVLEFSRDLLGSIGERARERVEERRRRRADEESRNSSLERSPKRTSRTPGKTSQERAAQGVVDLYPELEVEGAVRPSAKSSVGSGETAQPDGIEVVLPEEQRRPDLHGGGLSGEREEGEPGEYTPPPMSLLELGGDGPEHDAEGTSQRLTQALADLGVAAHVVRAVVGPRVTRYELRLGSGVKVGKISNLQQDIAYALAATEVRILAPIPGKSAVGVEVPNTRPAKVTLGDVFADYPEGNDWALPVGLGKDISGRAVFLDLAEMPHLLVAGTTGSGKSVMLNGLLTSLLLATDPREVKMVLIDPKRVELSQFARIPHLITPVVTDVKKAANALGWAVSEMERRYEVLEQKGVRSLEGYNARAEYPMPYVLVVIDELADLMMQAGAKVEDAIVRLAQKARAVGIHLVVATQRPSVDVITGMIKANIPSRIAFAVSSQVDSRVILDTSGAEALLGMGDMLYKPVSAARSSRVQGAFISEPEVERVVSASVAAARGKAETKFVEEVTAPKKEKEGTGEPEDDLLPEAASFVVSTQQASVSAVQRRFRVGYSRAGRIIDALERKGIVGPYEGSKSRSVVASELDLSSIFDDGSGSANVSEAGANGHDWEGFSAGDEPNENL